MGNRQSTKFFSLSRDSADKKLHSSDDRWSFEGLLSPNPETSSSAGSRRKRLYGDSVRTHRPLAGSGFAATHFHSSREDAESPAVEPKAPRSRRLSDSHKEYLIHIVTPNDTVAGVALRFGVKVADLRRVNKLWAGDLITARREVIIPTSSQKYLEFLSQHTPSGREPDEAEKREMCRHFSQIVHCDEDTAMLFIRHSGFRLDRAIGLYQRERSQIPETAAVETNQNADLVGETRRKPWSSRFDVGDL